MNDKVRSLLMLMVGAYITFLGGDLLAGVIKGTSGQPVLFAVIGTIFAALGIFVVLYNIKRTRDIERRLDEEAAKEAEEEENNSKTTE